jgi:hypothetical protein
MGTRTLEDLLDSLTAEGDLYEKHPDGSVTCFACGHRCLIKPGRRGICKVRFNRDRSLEVPWGYVGAVQCDPTEKKPFFHIFPGSDTLTFGMLGCDMHCPYCFTGQTRVPTSRGMETLESMFLRASTVQHECDGDIASIDDLHVLSQTGRIRPVRAVFRHLYSGEMLRIAPAFVPSIECTPDHRFLAVPRPKRGKPPRKPSYVQARDLSRDWCLAIPKRFAFHDHVLDVAEWVASVATSAPMKRQWSDRFLHDVLELRAAGYGPLAIATRVGHSRRRVSAVIDRVATGQSSASDLLRYKGLC